MFFAEEYQMKKGTQWYSTDNAEYCGECYLRCSRGGWRVQNLPLLPGADGCQSRQVGLPLSHLSQLLLLHLHNTHVPRWRSTIQCINIQKQRLVGCPHPFILPLSLSVSDAAALGPLVELETARPKARHINNWCLRKKDQRPGCVVLEILWNW